MRFRAVALLAILPVQPAFGQVAAGNEKFACDAPGGAFSKYQRLIGPGPIVLTATVRVNQLRGTGEWRPVINVMLNGGAGSRVGFRFIPDSQSKKTIIFVSFPGTKGGEETAIGEAEMKAPFDITINADSTSTQVSVNGISKSGPVLRDAVWTLDLSCSSVDAHIDDIAVRTG